MIRHLLLVACVYVLTLVLVEPASAQIKGNPELKAPAPQQSTGKSSSKLSQDLKKLYEGSTPGVTRADSKAKPVPSNDALNKYMQIKGDKVLVDITVKGNTSTARADLEKMGLQVTGVFGRVISGMMPIKALPQLESAGSVKFVRPAYKPLRQSMAAGFLFSGDDKDDKKIKPVISQGDTAQRSYLARKKYHVDGKGVKVGILSDSYNNLGTADEGVKHGELPGPANPFKFKKPVQILQDLDSGGTDEGRAMAEIVHDVAPGAELAFNTANLGQAAFAQGIVNLSKAGSKVIVDDVLYYAEPFFQDGIVAQAVDQVKQKGVTYFSSAGNVSVRSYESDYRASDFAPFGPDAGTAHNFSAPSDPPRYFQPIYIPTNGTFIASFQWDQPFFSAGGAGAESDLDMFLLDAQGNIVALGASDNIASGDPAEVFGYFNSTTSTTFYLLILKFAGPDPHLLKYVSFGDALFYITTPAIPGILAPTLYGHAKAAGAIATAAAFYLETPAYGVDTPRVEFFSSEGGIPNYFDLQGNRIAPLIRKKPEITAPDGGNTSFFDPFGNGDIAEDSDTYPNFFGTSAAAPHAAGVAALMIEAQKLKTITPDQIKGVLAANAIDMDDIHNTPQFDKGFDFNTGAGFIRADAAVEDVRFPKVFIKNLSVKPVCSDNPALTRNWKITNPNPFEVEVHWFLTGFPQQGSLTVSPGDTVISTTTAYTRYGQIPNILIIDWDDNFGFPRVDIAVSNKAQCGKGKDAIAADDTDLKTVDAENEAAAKQAVAEVYPNPSASNFRLYLSLKGQESISVELFTIDGKKLAERKSNQPNGIIDIEASGYKPGLYILKLRQGEFTKIFKLIKQ